MGEINLSDAFPAIEEIINSYSHRFSIPFVAGQTYIQNSGHLYDTEEVNALIRVVLGGHWLEGKEIHEFECSLAHNQNRRSGVFCNSGSSANLLAISALMSSRLKSNRLRPGMEVITSVVGFPTTLNAILQNGLVPVLVDISIPSYNANPVLVEEAISKKTGALMLAHTLGNPISLGKIDQMCEGTCMWSVFDNCDALGGLYDGKPLGQFGDMATYSFYPAHQITTGEGGCILTDSPMLDVILHSFRDWGKDCHCRPGQDNACGKRFGHCFDKLPEGYDHKFVFSEIGYNLKGLDLQAAIGNVQLKKLKEFTETRKSNWQFYRDVFADLGFDSYFILPEKQANSDPSWFGFALTIKDDAPFTCTELTQYLDKHKVGSRKLFGGNLLRQPAYSGILHRTVGIMKNADIVTENTFWIGVQPSITASMRQYVVEIFSDFIKEKAIK